MVGSPQEGYPRPARSTPTYRMAHQHHSIQVLEDRCLDHHITNELFLRQRSCHRLTGSYLQKVWGIQSIIVRRSFMVYSSANAAPKSRRSLIPWKIFSKSDCKCVGAFDPYY